MTGPRLPRRLVPEGARPALVGSAVVGIGLLVVLAATTDLPTSGDAAPGASLAVRLPDAVRLTVLVLLGLSGIAWLSLLRSRPIRGGLDLQQYRRLRLRSLAMAFALPLGVLAYMIWMKREGGEGQGVDAPFAALRSLLDLLAQGRKPPASAPLFDLAAATLVLGLALASFILMVLVALGGRVEWRRSPREGAEAPAALRHTVDESLEDLRTDPDARRAIVRVWRRLEDVLAGVHTPRAPWQTPSEFMRAVLARLPVPPGPVERLTALFEVARFSDRPLGPEARDVACDCLEEIGAALAPEGSGAR